MRQRKLLVLVSPELADETEALLDSESLHRMATLSPTEGNGDRAASLPVDAVVLRSDTLTEEERAFLEALYMSRERLAFVLICGEADAALLSRAMSCGITLVLNVSDGPETIQRRIEEEITRVRSRQESARVQTYDSRVIALFGTKGGTGKTTVAVNMAAALQKAGKRVALVDLDLQFGDVGVFLNVPRCDTISDLVSEPNLNPSTVKSFLYTHESGLSLLCAPVSPELAELVKPEHIERILTVLRAEFDYLVLDLAPSLDDNVLSALEYSDAIYFVTTPEIPTLKNSRVCLSLLRTLNYGDRIRLILNREGDAYVKRKDVQTTLETEPVLCIPQDIRHVSAAMNRGIPLVTASPRAPAARAITRFVKKALS